MIPIPACRVVLAPGEGRLHSTLSPMTPVALGDVVAVLDTPRGMQNLLAPGPGVIGGSLVRDRQQVAAREGVLWLTRR